MPKVIARLGSRLKTRRGALRPVPGLRAECCCSTHDGHLQACVVLPVYRQIVAILLRGCCTAINADRVCSPSWSA